MENCFGNRLKKTATAFPVVKASAFPIAGAPSYVFLVSSLCHVLLKIEHARCNNLIYYWFYKKKKLGFANNITDYKNKKIVWCLCDSELSISI